MNSIGVCTFVMYVIGEYFLNSSTNNITNTSLYRDDDQNLIYNWDNTLTYTHNWGEHHLLAEIGIVANDYQGNADVNATYQGLSVNTYGQASFNYSLPPAQRVGGGGDGQETRFASYLARVTYNYAEKYLLTANFRRDVRATGLLVDTGDTRSEGPGRPGRLYHRA